MSKLKKARKDYQQDDVKERDTANPHLSDLFRLRRQLRKFIGAAESKLLDDPSQRNTYTVLALYSQYREVISEIRSIEDQNRYGEIVYDKIIVPLLQSVFQNYSDSTFATLKLLRQTLGAEKYEEIKSTYEKLTVEHGRHMQEAREEFRGRLIAIFEDPT